MKVNKRYLIVFMIIFLLEVYIALFVRDQIIRPYIGDILVIVLLYCLIKIVWEKSSKLLPLYLFIFAGGIEVAQYFRIVELLGLGDNKWASLLIGTTFDIKDIVCYGVSMVLLFIFEGYKRKA